MREDGIDQYPHIMQILTSVLGLSFASVGGIQTCSWQIAANDETSADTATFALPDQYMPETAPAWDDNRILRIRTMVHNDTGEMEIFFTGKVKDEQPKKPSSVKVQ